MNTKPVDAQTMDGAKWFKGNLHTHSLWSDGDDFPEMIARWYADNGYDFLSLTDHNILSRGDRWMDLAKIEERGGDDVLKKYREAFGDEWVQTRDWQGKTQIRLYPLDEFRDKFEAPGSFLLIEGEEISDAVDGMPIHLNATNLESLLYPTGGEDVREALDSNLRAAADQAARSGREIMVHINHPNFGWAITAEELAAVTRGRFFEVYNGHNSINHLGDDDHPSIERMWDIINTLRIDKLDSPPVYGLGTDDSHYYHGRPGSHPGRGWVCVRSAELSADALIKAMFRGDFYASSGVELSEIDFNKEARELSFEIVPSKGETFTTQFIGTRRGYNEESTPRKDSDGEVIRSTRVYSSDVGEVLATTESQSPVYKFDGDELYVRAVITSSKSHPDPSFNDQRQQAWTQPVGWEK